MTSTTMSRGTSSTAGTWRNAARLAFGGFFLTMATYKVTVTLPNAAASYQQVADELAWPGFDWLLRLVVPAAALLLLARDYDRSLWDLLRPWSPSGSGPRR